ncbi:eCIS core domain-containing M35 family metalloendopeptidase [Niabella aquatica]
MKRSIYRRIRRRSTHDVAQAGKERGPEQPFFGITSRSTFFQAAPVIQHKCEKCKEEEKLQRQSEKKEDEKKLQRAQEKEDEKLQKKEAGNTTGIAPGISNYIHSLNGKGHSLSAESNQFFSEKMGYDFSNVKIHTGKEAAASAREVNAKAYTVGEHIVFNDGYYNAGSADGKKLMAHELTHVVQQGGSAASKESLQRKTPAGFEIEGLFSERADYPETIFYEKDSAMIPSSEWYKLSSIAGLFRGTNITLTGSASEEGDPATNATIVNTRISGVDRVLGRLGHTGVRSPNPQPAVSSGNMDYRRSRNVEVIATPTVIPPTGIMPTTAPPCAVTTANPTPETEPCGGAFAGAFPLALSWVAIAHAQVAAATPTATAQASLLFPGVPITVVEGHLRNLLGQVAALPLQHRCHNTCDGGCSRPAYNRGTGSSSMMTLCPDFLSGTNTSESAQTLVHESLHATSGLATVDTAYSTTRLIQNLTGSQALTNTDSYVLLVLRLAGVTALPLPAADNLSSLLPGEQTHAARALSALEQWLLNADFDTSLIYTAMDRNIGRASGWHADDGFAAEDTHQIASFVGLTDPGPDPYLNAPVAADKAKMAGMWDRFNPMMWSVYMRNITVNKVSGTAEKWAPGMGAWVDVNNSFFSMSAEDSVKHLLRLLIIVQGRVPAVLVDAYVEVANVIRKQRSTGP